MCEISSQSGKRDKVVSLFEREAEKLLKSGQEWEPWFALPYLKPAAAERRFPAFFTKEWAEAVSVTSRNFFSTAFSLVPLPGILRLGTERQKAAAKELEIARLKAECKRLTGLVEIREQVRF